jgi:gas vesicle protein
MNKHTNQHVKTPPKQSGNFLTGALFGWLAGAGAMLLFAPQSGKRTRAELQLKSLELREQATEAVENSVAQTCLKANQLTADLREKVKEIQHTEHALYAEQKERLREAVALSAETAPNHKTYA